MAQRIFISYGRKDDYLTPVGLEEEHTYHHDPTRSFTRQLYDALIAAGFDVWWDRERMPNRGLTFLQEIRQAVHDSDKLVYVSGDHASKSDYVKAEWQYALSQCKPVIPLVRNGDYALIPSEISMGNAPDVRDMRFFDEKIKELIRLLSDATSPTATLYGVPTLPDWYVERGNDVADLQKAIRADALKPIVVTSKQQTITLQGMGGLGKTTLATALCKRCDVRQSFPDGIFWLEMGKTPSVATRQGDIGVAFGDVRDEYPDEQRGKARLSDLLRNRAALIVLDDVWDHRHVEAFRIDSPASRVMVTTRDGRMATLLGVSQHTIDTLTAEEGMALIGKRLGRAEGEASAHADAERKLVELLGGHTLAISIAAARIAEEGADYVPRYLQRLQDRRAKAASPLGDLKMHDDDKNYNLELSLAESYDELKPTEQAYFRALGVFAVEGSFDRAALQAVWDLQDEYAAEDAVKALLKFALLSKGDGGRYSVHGLLRDYARALAEKAGEWQSAFNRYADHFTQVAEQFDTLPLEQWRQLDADLPHIDFVGDELARLWADESKRSDDLTRRAGDFAWAVESYVYRRPRAIRGGDAVRMRGLNWLVVGLDTFRLLGRKRREAATLHQIGSVYSKIGAVDEALKHFNQALPILREVQDRAGEAATLTNIGSVYSKIGAVDEALKHFNQALPIRREVQDRAGEAATLHQIGSVYLGIGAVDEALRHFNQALPILREVQDRAGEAATLTNIGSVYSKIGAVDEALKHFNQALPIRREVQDRAGEAATLHQIGSVYLEIGAVDEALKHFNQALPILREVQDRAGEAATLTNIGSVYLGIGAVDEALKHFNQALPIRREVQDRAGEAATLTNIGSVYSKIGAVDEALKHFNQALPIRREVQDRAGEAATLHQIGSVYSKIGAVDEALKHFNQALPILREVQDRAGEAATLTNIGSVYSKIGAVDEALKHFNQALPIRREVQDRAGEAATLTNIGSVYSKIGAVDEALKHFNQALPILREVQDRAGEAATLANIGSVYLGIGAVDEALKHFNQALPILREVQDRAGEAATCFNIGVLYFKHKNDLDQAIIYVEQATQVTFPQDPNLPTFRQTLAQLKAMRDGGGASAPSTPQNPATATLPAEVVNTWCQNTVAVKTSVPERHAEWLQAVQSIRADIANKGADWAQEVVFVDALIAILEDKSVSIADENPYANVVKQVQDIIASYKSS